MAAQSERVFPDSDEATARPIELITENGFGICRSWEISGDSPPTRGPYDFVVECPDGSRRNVRVAVAHHLLRHIEIHTRGRITLSNQYWICCAENHLATYIGECDRCPDDGKLRVEELSPDDLMLTIRWERT